MEREKKKKKSRADAHRCYSVYVALSSKRRYIFFYFSFFLGSQESLFAIVIVIVKYVSSLLFSPDQECSPVITNITYFVRAFRGCCLYLVLFSIRQPKRPLPGGVVVGEAPLSHLHISHPMSTSCPDASQILPLNSRSSNRLGDDDDNEAREERETPRGWPSFYNIQSRGCFHRQLHYRNRCQKTPSLLVIAPPRGRRN